ncbi:hypothetical protein OCU04_012481 [Sclerotinia nivalis]|uniref:Solute carrier family 40 member n=1 Tax=Sclerotinia nivalis TaxID=352851 RepID=A0A9X0A916_9HELO|nr:hypothetical protein OCU04_012481 [Sclerotinia nivalis]
MGEMNGERHGDGNAGKLGGMEGEALRLDFEVVVEAVEMGLEDIGFVSNRYEMMDGDENGNRIGTGGVQNESDSDDGLRDEEEDALISNAQEETHTEMEMDTNTNMEMEIEMDKSQAWNLYLSHFLSTWNGRSYEFAAIIFTANAWPDTLVAASIRGIVRTLASICFSSSVGRWVDKSPDRLKTLLTTITINRIAVICASTLWFFVVEPESGSNEGMSPGLTIENMTVRNAVKIAMFALILGFGILEGLSANGNMLSMERDWVVVAAAPEGKGYDLTHLNSTMRRIDLGCKLFAPILISFLISALGIKIGVVLVGGMNAVTWGVEMWCARRVWKSNTRLQMRKDIGNDEVVSNVQVRGLMEKIAQALRLYREDFQNYFSSKVWIPSLSLSLLHLSALSYGATFITFLLNVGFSLDLITLARAVGSVFEISSTVVTPFGVRHLSKAHGHGQYDRLYRSDDSDESLLEGEHVIDEPGRVATGLERLGLWGLSWQLINLIPVTLILWTLSSTPSNSIPTLLPRIVPSTNSILLPLLLFTALSFSRLGLWIFDLTTQQLTQTLVTPTQRSSFTGCEYSLVAFFELGNNVMAMVWSRPEQFKWVALVSLGAVGFSAVMYAGWVRSVRGHLVHWERVCRRTNKCGRG